MTCQEVIGALDLILDGQIANGGIPQARADRDEDIGKRFGFGDDRLDSVQGQNRFLGGDPDDRFKEIVLDTAVAHLRSERGFAHTADSLDADDKGPAVGLQRLQDSPDFLFSSDEIGTPRQACQNTGFLGFLGICCDAFDLLAITSDRLLFHCDTVDQVQWLVGPVSCQHFLEDVQILLM